jgi:hypothetical protein
VEVQLHTFLNSALGGVWSASRPSRFTPGEGPGTHWIEGWLDPRAILDAVAKTIPFLLILGIEPRSSSPSTFFLLADLYKSQTFSLYNIVNYCYFICRKSKCFPNLVSTSPWIMYRNKLYFFMVRSCYPSPNPQAVGTILIGCP